MKLFKAVFAATCVVSFLVLTGCASTSGKPIQIDMGNVAIVAIVATHNSIGVSRSFHGTVYADSDPGHEQVGAIVNAELVQLGYTVEKHNPALLFSITEIYAGPLSGYQSPTPEKTNITAAVVVDAVSTGAVCLLLNSCGNVAMMSNTTLSNVDALPSTSDHGLKPGAVDAAAELIVVDRVCIIPGYGCTLSAATSRDPKVTLDALRSANARDGLPRAMNMRVD